MKKSISKIIIFSLVFVIISYLLCKNFITYNDKKIAEKTKLQTQSLQNGEETVCESSCQSYQSYRNFPYDTMKYIDEKGFDLLEKAYCQFDFRVELKKTNKEEDYREKFCKMLKDEMPIYVNEIGESAVLSRLFDIHFDGIKDDDYLNASIYFFDVDEDGNPELCVAKDGYFTHVYKYDTERDEISLWKEWKKNYYLLGSGIYAWNWDGIRYAICHFDENGDINSSVFFYIMPWYEDKYIVSYPNYRGGDVDIPEVIEDQSYIDSSSNDYCLRVNEQQYEQLTSHYFEAEKLSDIYKKEIAQSYDQFVKTVSIETISSN